VPKCVCLCCYVYFFCPALPPSPPKNTCFFCFVGSVRND
jgi:hypothetical protein